MSIREQIEKDFIEAFKAKEEKVKSVLGMIKAALKNKEIEIQKELSNDDVMDVLSKEAKKRKESAQAYKDGGRKDLADQEISEYEVLKKYLPEELSEDAVRDIVKTTISETGATSPADMGKVIGAVMSKVKNQADGGLVSKLVKEELNK